MAVDPDTSLWHSPVGQARQPVPPTGKYSPNTRPSRCHRLAPAPPFRRMAFDASQDPLRERSRRLQRGAVQCSVTSPLLCSFGERGASFRLKCRKKGPPKRCLCLAEGFGHVCTGLGAHRRGRPFIQGSRRIRVRASGARAVSPPGARARPEPNTGVLSAALLRGGRAGCRHGSAPPP